MHMGTSGCTCSFGTRQHAQSPCASAAAAAAAAVQQRSTVQRSDRAHSPLLVFHPAAPGYANHFNIGVRLSRGAQGWSLMQSRAQLWRDSSARLACAASAAPSGASLCFPCAAGRRRATHRPASCPPCPPTSCCSAPAGPPPSPPPLFSHPPPAGQEGQSPPCATCPCSHLVHVAPPLSIWSPSPPPPTWPGHDGEVPHHARRPNARAEVSAGGTCQMPRALPAVLGACSRPAAPAAARQRGGRQALLPLETACLAVCTSWAPGSVCSARRRTTL